MSKVEAIKIIFDLIREDFATEGDRGKVYARLNVALAALGATRSIAQADNELTEELREK